jgi:hypothetical protein
MTALNGVTWTPFMAGPAPTVTASNIALAAGVSPAASSLFSATDGGTFTHYEFYDATGSGHFVVNGTNQAANTVIDITAAQLAQTTYVGGTASEQLYVRAFDDTNWSAWAPFAAAKLAKLDVTGIRRSSTADDHPHFAASPWRGPYPSNLRD